MKILVCGGRDFADWVWLERVLDGYPEATTLISGCALGADRLGEAWARKRGIPIERYPAEWELHGKAAGPIRNARMLAEGKPDLVVAFPGGKGTAHMIRIARHAGVHVVECKG